MIVKTFDPQTLREKETVTEIISLLYYDRFYKVGSFEIETTSDKFCKNDIIAFSSKGRIKSGIVLKIVEKENIFSVYGYDLKGMYGFRYITEPKEYSGTPDFVLKQMVTEFLKTGERDIEALQIGGETVPGDSVTFTPEQGFLEDSLVSASVLYEIGTRIDFDLEGLVFRTLKGEDKTADVIFAPGRRNVSDIEYTEDIFNTYNVGYTKDDDGNVISVGDAKGLFRRECYKEKNIDEYLKEKAEVEALRASPNELYECGVDYNLGDYVTVIKKDLATVKQITEIKEVHEHGQTAFYPVFGTEKENPIKKILKGA